MAGLEGTEKLLSEQYPGTKVTLQHLDVGIESSVADIFSSAISKYGRVDFLANVAGYGHPARPVTETTLQEWERSFSVNLRGVSLPWQQPE